MSKNDSLGVRILRPILFTRHALLYPDGPRVMAPFALYVVNTQAGGELHVGEVVDFSPVAAISRSCDEPCVLATIQLAHGRKVPLRLYQEQATGRWLSYGKLRVLALVYKSSKPVLSTPQDPHAVGAKPEEVAEDKVMGMTAADLLGIEKRSETHADKAAPETTPAVRRPPFYAGLLRVSERYMGIGFNDEIN